MALTGEITKNGIKLTEAYIRPIYIAINFEGGFSLNYETFPVKGSDGQFPNETLQGTEPTKEELDSIKAVCYGIAKRTELLKNMEDC